MPSAFLKKRYPKMLSEWSGQETVRYFAFVASTADPVTGEVDEATAYDTEGVFLPAIVNLSPSQRLREQLGLEQDFAATVEVPVQEIESRKITVKLGDKFELPEDADPYYVIKIVPSKQVENKFIAKMIALSHKVGRR